MMFFVMLGTTITFSSCSSDDDNNENSSSLPAYIKGGTWIAETVGWYFYISFDDKGHFDYTKQSKRGSEGQAKGTYKYNAKTHIITCTGYSGTVYTDGDVQSGDFNAQFEYDESRRLLKRIESNTFFAKDKAYVNTED